MRSSNITHCIKRGVKYKVHQVYKENKLTVTMYVQNVYHWHAHKNAISLLAIGQLSHQSATAPSLATHARSRCCRSSSMSWTWQWQSYLRHM